MNIKLSLSCYRDDMAKSYGGAYSERSADEGFGERYGESVKITTEKKESTTELQRGETAERDQQADAGNIRVHTSRTFL